MPDRARLLPLVNSCRDCPVWAEGVAVRVVGDDDLPAEKDWMIVLAGAAAILAIKASHLSPHVVRAAAHALRTTMSLSSVA